MALAQLIVPSGDPHIRQARYEDAAAIARLFLISSDGLARYIWSKSAAPGQPIEALGAARYGRTNTAFSYQNCLLAEQDSNVVGMAHAYRMEPRPPGEIEDDPVLKPYGSLEDPGSLYLAGLAVHASHRGHGIGSMLMDRVERLAIERNCSRVSLICFERNEAAVRLYRRRGYREIARGAIVPHPSLRYDHGDALLLVRGP